MNLGQLAIRLTNFYKKRRKMVSDPVVVAFVTLDGLEHRGSIERVEQRQDGRVLIQAHEEY